MDDGNRTLLALAVLNGHTEIVKDIFNPGQYTPEICDHALMRKLGSIDAPSDKKAKNDKAKKEHGEARLMLVKKAVMMKKDLDKSVDKGEFDADMGLKMVGIFSDCECHRNPLMLAAVSGFPELVPLIIEGRALL